jgi:hypothetical protein
MPLRWQIVRTADPALRRWGGEYLAHHALSNDTYRLSGPAGRILTELMAAQSDPGGRSASPLQPEEAEAEAALSVLADLGFISPC